MACGSDNPNIDPSRDGGVEQDAASGVTWALSSAFIRQIEVYDPAVLNPERTTRILVTTEVTDCDILAMPGIIWEAATNEVFVDMRVWRPRVMDGCTGETVLVQRPVSLRFPSPGTWSVRPGIPGRAEEGITVDIEAAPNRACTPLPTNCEMDCDCEAGEACLGANGFVGPYTQCAVPCELDRDCGGKGVCTSTLDGLGHYCDASQPECGDTQCPTGFSCQSDACQPDFALDEGARAPCGGDQDCTAPMHCAEPTADGGQRRCELLCQTPGTGWCSTGYACGQAADDGSGLASVDSVCMPQ